MTDQLREELDQTPFFDRVEETKPKVAARRRRSGITPFQRFFIAGMVFFMVFILGSLCLIVTGRIVPPALF